jgi:hypothetical protein
MPEKNVRAGAPNLEKCHTVLDGPECIEGVPPGRKSDSKKASPPRGSSECHSVFDAPECIEGTRSPERQRGK